MTTDQTGVDIYTDLNVSEAVSFNGTLTVGGDASFNGTLTVGGDASLNGHVSLGTGAMEISYNNIVVNANMLFYEAHSLNFWGYPTLNSGTGTGT